MPASEVDLRYANLRSIDCSTPLCAALFLTSGFCHCGRVKFDCLTIMPCLWGMGTTRYLGIEVWY